MKSLNHFPLVQSKLYKLILLCILSFICVLGSAQIQTQAQEDSLKAKITAVRHRMNSVAINQRNTDAATRFFTEDYLYMEPNIPPIYGRDAYFKRINRLLSTGFKLNGVSRDIYRAWSNKNLIYEVGTANYKIFLDSTSKTIINDPTNYFTIWETQADGSIRQKYSIWNTSTNIEVDTAGVITEAQLRAEVLAVRSRIDNLAIKGVNTQEVKSFFTEDYLYMEPNRPPINSRDEYLKLVDRLLATGFKLRSVDRNILKIWSSENLIYEIGTANFKILISRDAPTFIDDPTSYITVWERQTDGSIRQKSSIWNTNKNIPVNTPDGDNSGSAE